MLNVYKLQALNTCGSLHVLPRIFQFIIYTHFNICCFMAVVHTTSDRLRIDFYT